MKTKAATKLTTPLQQIAYLTLLLTLITAQAANVFWKEPGAENDFDDSVAVDDGTRLSAASAAALAQADLTLDATLVTNTFDWSALTSESVTTPEAPMDEAATTPIQTGAGSSVETELLAAAGTTFEAAAEEKPAYFENTLLLLDTAAGTLLEEVPPAAAQNDSSAPTSDPTASGSSDPMFVPAPVPEPSTGLLALWGVLTFACSRPRAKSATKR